MHERFMNRMLSNLPYRPRLRPLNLIRRLLFFSFFLSFGIHYSISKTSFMSHSPPPEGPSGSSSNQSRKRRNSAQDGEEGTVQRQRTHRTTLACERCRSKKLRCMGGHPCSACKRAKSECDFGDRGESQQSISATNQRLVQLEKTVTDLVAGLSHLTQPRPADSFVHQQHPASPAQLTVPRNDGYSADQLASMSAGAGSPRWSNQQTIAVAGAAFPARSSGSPLSRTHREEMTFGPMRSPSANPRVSERLESRWAALQQNSAPFPPLMTHPTAWNEEPANTSPDGGVDSHSTLGMTYYKAQVHLQSEPILEGIVGEVAARALFTL